MDAVMTFVERLRAGKFEEVVASRAPCSAIHSSHVAAAPFSVDKKEKIDIVNVLLQFERRRAHLEVVQLETGEIAGWWENTNVPQREVELLYGTDGRWIADGFRYRLPDVILKPSMPTR